MSREASSVARGATGRRVLIVVENLSVPFDRRVWRECSALREAGCQVSVISPKGIGTDLASHEMIDGVAVYRYPSYPSDGSFLSYVVEYSVALMMTFWVMWVVLVREGFDAVQICNPPDLLILAALPFKMLGKRIIFDQHDLSPEIYEVQRGRDGKHRRVIQALLAFERLTYFFSDVVIVVNESCRRIAVERGAKASESVFVVRNGPPLGDICDVQPNPALKRGKRYLLCYVGMMGPQEGIDLMLRAIRALGVVHGRTDFHVQIMGGGTVLDSMRGYAAELEIEHDVTFSGYVDHDRVLEAIATADVCLCPDPKTPLSDKCSLVKAIEYMSLGRPFVTFDLDEVRLSAADAALYAEPNDEADFSAKINYLLDNEELRGSMGKVGKDRVFAQLAWDHSKRALYAAYDAAFERRRRVAGAAT